MNAAIIIPVYNHEQFIAEVIRQALTQHLPVIVVNDGSTDRTAEIIKDIDGITVLQHSHNQGKGAAILTGCAAAVSKGCDAAITIDGDGQHKPEDAQILLATGNAANRCIVVGRRKGMERGNNVPWTSRFGRKFSNFWVWVSGGPLIRDSQSGFRLYPIPEILQLGVRARKYQFEVEILVKARQHHIEIIEVPIQVVYQPQGKRVSHFRPWVDFMRNSATFSRLIFARIIKGIFRT